MMAPVTTDLPSRATRSLLILAALLGVLWMAGSARAATVTVGPGDTLSAIAARNGTSVAALAGANGISDPDHVVAGRRLVLPGPGGASASGGSYRIRPGDSLSSIAARHGVGAAALAAANHITNPNMIVAGRLLVVPGGGTASVSGGTPAGGSYRVRPGDTLGGIAARHGTSVRALAALNGIHDPGVIVVGRMLRVPAGGPVSSPAFTGPTSSIEVASLLSRHAARYGVDPALARAIAWQESGWSQSVRSSVGAIGVMQLLPATARWLGRDVVGRHLDPNRLEDNIEGGVAYLAWLRHRSGSTRRTIAAYYQGLASLRRIGPYDDTKAYVRSVTALIGRV